MEHKYITGWSLGIFLYKNYGFTVTTEQVRKASSVYYGILKTEMDKK